MPNTNALDKKYEAYLSTYFEKSMRLKHIIAGVNKSNGYPYLVFGYRMDVVK